MIVKITYAVVIGAWLGCAAVFWAKQFKDYRQLYKKSDTKKSKLLYWLIAIAIFALTAFVTIYWGGAFLLWATDYLS